MKFHSIIIVTIAVLLASCEDGSSDSAGDGGSGRGGSMARFAVSGDYLYTVSNNNLSVFDIRNTESPDKVKTVAIDAFVETIFPKDTLLFFGTRTGMLIYDKTNPMAPRYISKYEHIYSCDPVIVEKNYAFVTLNSESLWCGRGNNRLDIIDISNLYKPVAVAEHQMESPRGLGMDKNTLFVCDNGLKMYNVGDFKNIKLMQKFNADGYDVITDDGYLIMIGEDGFYQYSYTQENIELLSSILVKNQIYN